LGRVYIKPPWILIDNIKRMKSIAVIILNYKRQQNISDIILPQLVNNKHVSTVIIAHGLHNTVFGVDRPLEDEEIIRNGKVLHIGNFKANDKFCCWRRWKLIKELKDKGILTEEYIHSQDDDLVFDHLTIPRLLDIYNEGRGILVSGVPARNTINGIYTYKGINGSCNIVLGRSIFTKVDIICKAVEKANALRIPNEILKQDDICISYISLDNVSDYIAMKHYSVKCIFRELPANDALSSREDHTKRRNNAIEYFQKVLI
jgi:hypothetical protein